MNDQDYGRRHPFYHPKSNNDEIIIEDFGHPMHTWKAKNDPVMGGKSTATVTIDTNAGVAIFDGQVVNVPFLQAPGFVTMETRGGALWPDVSTCQGLVLTLRSSTPEYQGYRLSFGNVHVPGGRFAYGYKANFDVDSSSSEDNEFMDIYLPFHEFTAKWDDATGDAIVTCADNPQYCPTTQALQNLQSLIVWGEGVAGKIHLEIQSIRGAQCASSTSTAAASSLQPQGTGPSWLKVPHSPLALCFVMTAVLMAYVLKLMAKVVRRKQCDTSNYTELPVSGAETFSQETNV